MKPYLHRPISRFYDFIQGGEFKNVSRNFKLFYLFFYNTPPTSLVAHMTKDFLTYDSCLYYNFMVLLIYFTTVIVDWLYNTYL